MNEPKPRGHRAASAPPAITTSASPSRTTRKASPIAWFPVAHAVLTTRDGPRASYRMARWPAARLMSADVRANAEMPAIPSAKSTRVVSTISGMPPNPDPT